jgi:hypothetical protein
MSQTLCVLLANLALLGLLLRNAQTAGRLATIPEPRGGRA